MLLFFKRLTKRFKKPVYPIILVGTDYSSYELYQQFNASDSVCKVLFFIDEEPWDHRRFIGAAQIRYPVELLALVANHKIKAVICSKETDYLEFIKYKDRLLKLGCEFVLLDKDVGIDELEEKIKV